ncbi:DsbA family protein [Streptomyces gamaensis]|uniref:DsbA family protein n=1 Tax=Streptomyces gamaensis TaxID=1763542 RepID=A0ABW0YYA3_9ACTN
MSSKSPKSTRKPAGARTTPPKKSAKRRVAAIGAVVALVVALVSAGIAIGKNAGGSGKRHPSASGQSADPRQKLYDQAAKLSIRRQDGDPLAVGRADAPVVLVEYADYQCSFCGRFTRETQPELVKKYVDEGVLRIEFRNFPIFGDDSTRAARASWAAGRQGKFWEFHHELYAKTRKGDALAEDKLLDMAKQSGITDLDRFRADLNGDASQAAVKKDQEEGYSIGVQSTPTFLVNGLPISGAQPMSVFEAAVAQAKTAHDAGTDSPQSGK